MDSSSMPGAPWFALTLRQASQTALLSMRNDFTAFDVGSATGSSHGLVVDLWLGLNGPPASLQPDYRAFDATTGRSAPVPRVRASPLAGASAWGLPREGRPEA